MLGGAPGPPSGSAAPTKVPALAAMPRAPPVPCSSVTGGPVGDAAPAALPAAPDTPAPAPGLPARVLARTPEQPPLPALPSTGAGRHPLPSAPDNLSASQPLLIAAVGPSLIVAVPTSGCSGAPSLAAAEAMASAGSAGMLLPSLARSAVRAPAALHGAGAARLSGVAPNSRASSRRSGTVSTANTCTRPQSDHRWWECVWQAHTITEQSCRASYATSSWHMLE